MFNFTEKTFHRISTRNIRFVNLKTTIDNKKTRRGNYCFSLELTEQTEGGRVKWPIELFFLPQRPDMFFDRMFHTEDELLMASGDSRRAYLLTCNKDGRSAVVTDENVLNKQQMAMIKEKISEMFYLKQLKTGRRGAVICPFDTNKIGNFDVLIGEPIRTEA